MVYVAFYERKHEAPEYIGVGASLDGAKELCREFGEKQMGDENMWEPGEEEAKARFVAIGWEEVGAGWIGRVARVEFNYRIRQEELRP